MPRRRSAIGALHSLLCGLAKFLGDVQAVRGGPEAVVKRLARWQAGRMTSRMLWHWFR
jgi:hypothetical protein